jgi:hypothetical protein
LNRFWYAYLNAQGFSVDEVSVQEISGRLGLKAALKLDQAPALDHSALDCNLKQGCQMAYFT